MTQLIRSVLIAAPMSEVWLVISNFGGVHAYNPHVARSWSTSAACGGLGAMRRCELTTSGASLGERIVAWREPTSLAFEMYESAKTPPFSVMRSGLELRTVSSNTLATGTLEYAMKHGPAGALMDRLIVQPQFGKAFSATLAGLKHHVETGALVDEFTPLDIEIVHVHAPVVARLEESPPETWRGRTRSRSHAA